MIPITRRTALQATLWPLAAQLSTVCVSRAGLQWNGQDDSQNPAPSVVCFFFDGGLSHLDSFDVKPKAPADVRGEFSAIQTAVPGLVFSEMWPETAKLADRLTILRSLRHRHAEHDMARRCMHTLNDNAGTRTPSLGSVLQWQSGSRLPTYVSAPDLPDYTGALGSEYRSLALQGPVARRILQLGQEPGTLTKRLNQLQRLQNLNPDTDAGTDTLRRQQTTVREILESPVYRRMVDTKSLGDTLHDRYGRNDTGRMVLLARNALLEGMRFVVVNLSGWDMHRRIFESSQKRMPPADQALAALIQDLEDSGRLQHTVVLLMTEFGRTPRIVQREGTPGRDHWPHAMNLLLAGGPVPRGQVIGDTGPLGEECTTVQHAPGDLAASLYKWLKLDWEVMLPGEDARLNTSGTPIAQLEF